MKRVFIVSACRTPIGAFGGALAHLAPGDLGTVAAKEALARAGIEPHSEASSTDAAKTQPFSPKTQPPTSVDELILGNVLGAGHGMNLARQVCLKSNLSVSTPAYTVNKVCGSGLKAVTLAASEIALGEAHAMLAGGVESMSQAAFVSLTARWGNRLGHGELKDLILQDGLTDVFHSCHMGVTAENLAKRLEISRRAQDEYALESQHRAGQALKSGVFKEEIVGVPLFKKGKQTGTFEVDEFPKPDTMLEGLGALKPAFKADGTVTAGNASGINDGAAMLVLMSEERMKDHGLTPMAQIVAWASSAIEPEVMGLGPVGAVNRVLEKARLSIHDLDWIEANEAFAAQAIAVNRSCNWDLTKVNPHGGAIALGHPIGASGARILVTLLYQLRRTGKELGLATLCVGGGQGIAVVVRNGG